MGHFGARVDHLLFDRLSERHGASLGQREDWQTAAHRHQFRGQHCGVGQGGCGTGRNLPADGGAVQPLQAFRQAEVTIGGGHFAGDIGGQTSYQTGLRPGGGR